MDNIFEILIYLFIIVSFLSSLFRKKKKPHTGRQEQNVTPTPEPKPPQRTPQQEDYDILKEIEKMFKTNVPLPEKEKEETFEKERDLKLDPEHFRTREWQQPTHLEHKTTLSEHTSESWDEKRRKADESRKAVNKKIIRQAEMFEKHLKKKGSTTDIKKNIRQRFKEPASLKEFIIFSEIIGKPKALQE
ncbi:MAG: hypothetical protein Q7S39_00335 [Ignavibacteria bacterium]|nr:hypothetical protein [Ignavibacteria bacterium]